MWKIHYYYVEASNLVKFPVILFKIKYSDIVCLCAYTVLDTHYFIYGINVCKYTVQSVSAHTRFDHTDLRTLVVLWIGVCKKSQEAYELDHSFYFSVKKDTEYGCSTRERKALPNETPDFRVLFSF